MQRSFVVPLILCILAGAAADPDPTSIPTSIPTSVPTSIPTSFPTLPGQLEDAGFITLANFPSPSTCDGQPDVNINRLGECSVDDSTSSSLIEDVRTYDNGNIALTQTFFASGNCDRATEDSHESTKYEAESCVENTKLSYSFDVPPLPKTAFAVVTYNDASECDAGSLNFAVFSGTPLNNCYKFGPDYYSIIRSCDDTVSNGITQEWFSDDACTVSTGVDSFDPSKCAASDGGFVTTFCKKPTEFPTGYVGQEVFADNACSVTPNMEKRYKVDACFPQEGDSDSPGLQYRKFHDANIDEFVHKIGVSLSIYSDAACTNSIYETGFQERIGCTDGQKFSHVDQLSNVPQQFTYKSIYASSTDCAAGNNNVLVRESVPLGVCFHSTDENGGDNYEKYTCDGTNTIVSRHNTADCSDVPGTDSRRVDPLTQCAAFGGAYVTTSCTISPPSVAPTAAPTRAPSVVPTVVPTGAPVFSPTVAPTVIPTASPTSTYAPTAAPTPAAPTIVPTIVPTVVPTVVPTIVPTIEPTKAPTAVPTVVPVPTRAPTKVPTRRPTTVPTFAPTKATAAVSFSSFFTIADATNSNVTINDQTALRKAAAKSMNIAIGNVEYLGSTVSTGTSSVRFHTETVVLIVKLGITIKLSQTNFTDTTELYNAVTTALTLAVNSGNFTSELKSVANVLGSTLFDSASTQDVDFTELVVIMPPDDDTDDKDDGLTDGEIAGIVIGSVIGGILLIALIAYFMFHKPSKVYESGSNHGSDHGGKLVANHGNETTV